MKIVRSGQLHHLGLLAVRLRKAAIEALIHGDCVPGSAVASAIMLFSSAHEAMPNLGIHDPYGAQEMNAHTVIRRVCGDTIAIYGNKEDTSAEVRWLDTDNQLLSAWSFSTLDKAVTAVRRWNIASSSYPSGYSKELALTKEADKQR